MSRVPARPDMPAPPPRRFVRLHGEIKTPPFTAAGRQEAGELIRLLQLRQPVGMPRGRPMPSIAAGVLELRVRDEGHNWRLVLYVDADAVVLLDVFAKKTQKTPQPVIENCQRRLAAYLRAE
jgi:phage-related protein